MEPMWSATLTIKEWNKIEELIKYAEPKIARRIVDSLTLVTKEG